MIVSKKWYTVLYILVVAAGISLAAPHLADYIWQDEGYTLFNFAHKGFFYPFTNYHVPNNHPFFSSLMSLWWDWGDSITFIRLLPFIIFIIVLLLFAYTATTLGGPTVGILALLLFATSQVTENFVLQIRGYSFSWLPVTVTLLSLPLYIQRGSKRWLVLFIVSSAVSIATIPSNLIIGLAFLLWGFFLIFFNSSRSMREKLQQAVLILLGPLLGVASYGLIWRQVIKESHTKWSNWTYLEIFQHWLWATISDFILLIPLILLGAFLFARASYTDKSLAIGSPRSQCLLFLALIIAFGGWILLSSNPPFPRTFIPLLPVWYLAFGIFSAAALEYLNLKFPKTIKSAFVPLVLALFCLSVFQKEPCTTLEQTDEIAVDLCSQYFHSDDYQPLQTVILLEMLTGNERIPIITGFEGNYTLGFVITNDGIKDVDLMHYGFWPDRSKNQISYPPMIVVRDKNELRQILNKLGLPEKDYEQIATTGYFTIFKIQEAKEPKTNMR